MVLDGAMHRVWHRPFWLSPLFWMFALSDTMFPETGTNIPVRLVITPVNDRFGRPAQRWLRTFRFPRKRRFESVTVFDTRTRQLLDLFGPARMLEARLRVSFLPPDRIEIVSVATFVSLAGLRVRLPRVLAGVVRIAQTADPGVPGVIHMSFSLDHPLLGPIFGYEGTLQVIREPDTG